MTHANLPPEDAFDRWLDDLADGSADAFNDDLSDAATWLHRHFALTPPESHLLTSQHKAALRQRILPQRTAPATPLPPSGSAGIVASAPRLAPSRSTWTGRRVISLVSAAILVLLALASAGIVLRLDDTEQVPGVSATASLMPFAPSAVLASATPVPTCVTGDTLVLMPESEPNAGAFAALPFSVAWYGDGLLTVEKDSVVLRQIDIGSAERIEPTSWPDVLLVTTNANDRNASLVNVRTGDVAALGPMFVPRWTNGAYLLWASDASHFTWHIIDLRSFERVDLNQRFRIDPVQSWRPSVPAGNTSDDGTVILIDTPLVPSSEHVTPAAPASTPDLPVLNAGASAILVNGDLDHLSLVGPMSRSSGDTALSPDGRYMAWLASSATNPHEERILTIAETSTGEVIGQRPVEATYANSLMFSRDAPILYSTSSTALNQFVFAPNMATPAPASQPITLPEPGYSIVAASPDRTKLLLSIDEYAYGPALFWIDLDTGTLREIDGVIGRMWESTFPVTVAPRLGRYFLIDDLSNKTGILDIATGETVLTIDRNDSAFAATISRDGHTLMIPGETGIEIIDLASGATTRYPAPAAPSPFAQPLSISSEGACAVVTWRADDREPQTNLLSASGASQQPLPASTAGGWLAASVPAPMTTPTS